MMHPDGYIAKGQLPFLIDNFVPEVNPSKQAILGFLKSFPPEAVAAGYFTDLFTGQEIRNKDECYYESGKWWWTTQDIYHFEKYDMKLDDDFCKYVLNQVSQQS